MCLNEIVWIVVFALHSNTITSTIYKYRATLNNKINTPFKIRLR